MSKINVVIAGISENPTSNGNLIVKLSETATRVEVLPGVFKERKNTYYMAVSADASKKLKVNAKHEFNLDLFNVVERPFEHPEAGTIMLKWLHLK